MVRAMLKTMVCAAVLTTALPALAQDARQVERRVDRLESEMRAVQRKVFPGGDKRYFEPEFQPTDQTAAPPVGTPATSPIADLTTRVNAMERQLQTLTGQVEQANFKVRQMEEAMAKFRADAEFRLTQLEGGGQPQGTTPPVDGATSVVTPPAPSPTTAAPIATAPPKPALDATDPEAQYQAAYALVNAQQWPKAEAALQAFVAQHPKHRRASHAQYWLGRTHMAAAKPAQAAKAFLDNYKTMPKGERAADSMLWLGRALLEMNPQNASQACLVYNEVQAAYGAGLGPTQTDMLAKGRAAAKCPA